MAQGTTDPGNRSAAQIEREVDAERTKVSDTIDALQSKMSVGNIVDQVVQAMGTHGGDVARNLGRQVRENPLPLLLTGVGLAWLMTGQGSRSTHRGYHDEYDDDYGYDDDVEPYHTGGPAGLYTRRSGVGAVHAPHLAETGPTGGASSYSGTDPLRPHARPGGGTGHDEDGVGDTIKGAAGSVRDKAAGAAGSVRDSAASTASSVRGAASGTAGYVRDTAAGVSEAAGDLGRRVSGAVGDSAEAVAARARAQADRARWAAHDLRRSAARSSRHAQESIARLMEDQPLVFGALALAVGAAIGGALPRSRTEDELFGAESDRLKHAATSIAREESEKLQATAAGVVDEAGKMVDEAAASVDRSTGGGKTMVEKAEAGLGQAAERLTGRAKEEADRQKLGQPATPTDRK